MTPARMELSAATQPDPYAAAWQHLHAAAGAVHLMDMPAALTHCRDAIRLLELLAAVGDPETLGGGLLEILRPQERGEILHIFDTKRRAALDLGSSDAEAARAAAGAVAEQFAILRIPPADFIAALARREAQLEWVLSPAALRFAEALTVIVEQPAEVVIEQLLRDFLRRLNPAAVAEIEAEESPPDAPGFL